LRRKVFESELSESLTIADEVVLAGVFKSDAIAEGERLDPAKVIATLHAAHKSARLLDSAEEIVSTISPELRPGDVVAILSIGGFGGIYRKLPERLKALHEASTPA
jgi:UDP-N-acetylmuramate: L-alanyl-gamma-D-glutamyl-meso-diaminopimelate ligase